MNSLESRSPRWRTRGWAPAALFTACLVFATLGATAAHATTTLTDGTPAIETVAGSAGPTDTTIDVTGRSVWRSMMCGLARIISKLDPRFGDSAQMICEFIESLDGN